MNRGESDVETRRIKLPQNPTIPSLTGIGENAGGLTKPTEHEYAFLKGGRGRWEEGGLTPLKNLVFYV